MEYGSLQPGQIEDAKILSDIVARGNGHMLESSRQGVYLAVALIAAHGIWATGYSEFQIQLILGGLVASVLSSIVCHFLVGFLQVRNVEKFLAGNLEIKDGMNWYKSALVAAGFQFVLEITSLLVIVFG